MNTETITISRIVHYVLAVWPTSWRDKLWMRTVYPVRYEWRGKIQRHIANKAPNWLVYFVTIRAYSVAWGKAGDKIPDELTFDEVVKPWEPRKNR